MIYPGKEWQTAAPESQGVDSEKLREAVQYLESQSGPDGARELVIIRNGRLIFKGDEADKVHGIWSCTKSFTSTVLGILIEDGRCRLETKAIETLPEMASVYPAITLRHLTTMTSGYRAVGDEPRNGYKHGPSTTPFAPGPQPLFSPPGSGYAYWDSAMHLLGKVLTRIANEPIAALFRRRVADPIGMRSEKWDWESFLPEEKIPVNKGASGVSACALDLARFGHLFLNEGKWNGKQLINARWVRQATTVQVPPSIAWEHPESGIDARGCYGFNWWINGKKADGERLWPGAPPRTYAAVGYNNNKLLVIPEWRMVVVRLGMDESRRKITDKAVGEFLRQIGESLRNSRNAP